MIFGLQLRKLPSQIVQCILDPAEFGTLLFAEGVRDFLFFLKFLDLLLLAINIILSIVKTFLNKRILLLQKFNLLVSILQLFLYIILLEPHLECDLHVPSL